MTLFSDVIITLDSDPDNDVINEWETSLSDVTDYIEMLVWWSVTLKTLCNRLY